MLLAEDARMFSLEMRRGINICIPADHNLTHLNELGSFIYMFFFTCMGERRYLYFLYVNVCSLSKATHNVALDLSSMGKTSLFDRL